MTARPTTGPAIHVHGLEKSYRDLHLLCGVDFDVARSVPHPQIEANTSIKASTSTPLL